jgi:type II secretory pathway pseudopilin PulG
MVNMPVRANHNVSGYTYLGLLFAVALAGVALALVAELWSTANKRAKEEQLLFIGAQFHAAIRRYHEQSPGAAREYPKSFDDLLRDRRYPDTRRYLRKLFPDPMTGKFDWVVERAGDGGIAGVRSASQDMPLKIDRFPAAFDFGGAKKYSEWSFVFQARLGGAGANSRESIVSPRSARIEP